MAGLSTKDVKTGGGQPKIIEPGVHVLKINKVILSRPEFQAIQQEEGYFMVLDVESKPIDGFVGFQIDPDDESKGHYKGQIGQVKTNRYYYRDSQTKSGIEISRDMELLKQIKNICIATNTLSWFEKADGKYETIEEFVDAFNKDMPFKDVYLKFCIGGKEFEKKNNYVGYDLYLPKLTKGKLAFEAENAKASKLIEFNEAEHVIALNQTSVNSFGGGAADPLSGDNIGDLPKMPDEFEL